MADIQRVDLALEGRPGAGEVASILLACAVVFFLLVRFDGAAARDEAKRARAALAERAAAARQPKPAEETRRKGDESLGDAGPISVPVNGAWSAGTSPSVGHAKTAVELRRVVGPISGTPAIAQAAPVVPAADDGPPTVVLALLAGIGAAMALAGSTLIMRTRR